MATAKVRARRRKTRRRRAVAAAVGLAIAGAGVTTAAAVNGTEPRWRIGEVALGSVTQTIETSGTIGAAGKVTASFPVSGTVKSVPVKVGQAVSKGDIIATLDTTTLRAAVDSAKSTLASAEQRLEADKTGQTSAGGMSVTPSAYDGSAVTATFAVATSPATIVAAAAATGSNRALQAVLDAQDAVISAQKAVDSGQQAVDSARTPVDADVSANVELSQAQNAACATSPGSSGSSTECTQAQANYEASANRLATDMAALDAAIDAQDQNVANLNTAISTLDAAIKKLQDSSSGSGAIGGMGGSAPTESPSPAPTQSGAAPSTSPAPSTSAAPSTSQPSGGSTQTATPASAAQLAADQAAIDAAEAAVAVAEQNLAAATLTSPISGKIAAIGLTPGASSSGQTITVIGTGVQQVSTTVPLSRVDLVHVGEEATVAADGVATELHGTVASIGTLSTTIGTTTSFPVTIILDQEQPNLYDGTGADVVITTGSASNVITVPNSALHAGPRGTFTVIVVQNGVTTTKTVTLGVSDSDVTEVKSGLAVGDEVVLADLTEELPASSTTSTNTGRTGGFGGTGFPPGGFPGGGR